jgi:2-C-methyl-D-erythritol 2,4-cyclodiphosphate synthase
VSELRVGFGIDLHRVAGEGEPRPLVLGGVTFPGEAGLSGHSDADALAHALADAVLGAAGLDDIGTHFPDTDPRWKGADSLVLLAGAVELVAAQGWRLVNADCTVVAERPRIAASRAEMVAKLSSAAGGPVHVKGSRPEGLGSLGRLEGIACLAVVLLEK